jgi:hypothetical protein
MSPPSQAKLMDTPVKLEASVAAAPGCGGLNSNGVHNPVDPELASMRGEVPMEGLKRQKTGQQTARVLREPASWQLLRSTCPARSRARKDTNCSAVLCDIVVGGDHTWHGLRREDSGEVRAL